MLSGFFHCPPISKDLPMFYSCNFFSPQIPLPRRRHMSTIKFLDYGQKGLFHFPSQHHSPSAVTINCDEQIEKGAANRFYKGFCNSQIKRLQYLCNKAMLNMFLKSSNKSHGTTGLQATTGVKFMQHNRIKRIGLCAVKSGFNLLLSVYSHYALATLSSQQFSFLLIMRMQPRVSVILTLFSCFTYTHIYVIFMPRQRDQLILKVHIMVS